MSIRDLQFPLPLPGHSYGSVQTAEIVPREVHSKGGFQVRPLLREAIGEPRQPANLHSHRQIAALNVRRANPVNAWKPQDWVRFGTHNFSGANTFAVSAVNLDDSPVVNAATHKGNNRVIRWPPQI